MDTPDPFLHARFNFLCLHYVDCMKEYTSKVNELLGMLAEAHGEDDYGMFTVFIPDHHWSATIIHAYAAFEQKMNEACLIVQQSLGLGLHLKDVAGQGIHRARLYLCGYAKLRLDITDDQWRHVVALGKLRNVLVHGGFSTDHKDYTFLSNYASQTDAFSLGNTYIKLRFQTIEFTLNKLGSVLEQLGATILELQPCAPKNGANPAMK